MTPETADFLVFIVTSAPYDVYTYPFGGLSLLLAVEKWPYNPKPFGALCQIQLAASLHGSYSERRFSP